MYTTGTLTGMPTDLNSQSRRWAVSLPRPQWIVLATLVLVVVGIGLRLIVPVTREWAAINEMRSANAQVLTRDGGPAWLRERLGDERMQPFDRAVTADFHLSQADTRLMRRLAWFSELERLNLVGMPVTDELLAELSGLTRLQMLLLDSPAVTDTSPPRLSRLKNLRRLSLDKSQISDEGLMHLAALTRLEYLGLCGTRVSDAGIAELKRRLPGLCIYRSWMSHPDPGLNYLSTCDVVVAGRRGPPEGTFVVQLQDARGVICRSVSGQIAGDQEWALQLTLPDAWRPDGYRLELVSALGFRESLPITIVGENTERPLPRPQTRRVGKPLIFFPEVSIADCDADSVEVTLASPTRAGSGPRVSLAAGSEFTAWGDVRLKAALRRKLAPVVLQIIEVGSAHKGANGDLVIHESYAEPLEAPSAFRFVQAMLAPAEEGQYVLRAAYRGTVLCELPLDIQSPAAPEHK